MAKIIKTPTRGQPVDAALLSEIAEAVNDITRNIDLRKGKSYVKGTGTQSLVTTKSTANTSFYATTVKVKIDSENVTTSSKGEAEVRFTEIAFDGPPVVTATIVIPTESKGGVEHTAIVTVSDINKASCKINVRFAASGTVKEMLVQVIAVGLVA